MDRPTNSPLNGTVTLPSTQLTFVRERVAGGETFAAALAAEGASSQAYEAVDLMTRRNVQRNGDEGEAAGLEAAGDAIVFADATYLPPRRAVIAEDAIALSLLRGQ